MVWDSRCWKKIDAFIGDFSVLVYFLDLRINEDPPG